MEQYQGAWCVECVPARVCVHTYACMCVFRVPEHNGVNQQSLEKFDLIISGIFPNVVENLDTQIQKAYNNKYKASQDKYINHIQPLRSHSEPAKTKNIQLYKNVQ